MSPRVMILGSHGFMGRHFRALYPEAVAPRLDIADRAAVRAALMEHRPLVVINCAGKTGRPNVDWCETHPLETLHANATGALVVLEEVQRRGAYLVHLSSGCIYEGDNGGKGFSEDDPPNFAGSFYARTKAWADQAMREFPVLTLRMRMPFDGSRHERNLIVKLSRYPRVLTEQNSLTCIPDFLRVAERLIAGRATGIWNVVNEGTISPFEIMQRYRERVDPRHTFTALPLSCLGEVARTGRSNCVLDTSRLKAAGLGLPPVREAIERALGELRSGRDG